MMKRPKEFNNYKSFYIMFILYTLFIDDGFYEICKTLIKELLDEYNEEYLTLKRFIGKHRNDNGLGKQEIINLEIRESKIYKYLIDTFKEKSIIIKNLYIKSRGRWLDIDIDKMDSFRLISEENKIHKNNCVCGVSIKNLVIVIHKVLPSVELIIGSDCIDRFKQKEIILGKIEDDIFSKWFKNIFNFLNHVNNSNDQDLNHFQKSNHFIEKCCSDGLITENEANIYKKYKCFKRKNNGKTIIQIDNYEA